MLQSRLTRSKLPSQPRMLFPLKNRSKIRKQQHLQVINYYKLMACLVVKPCLLQLLDTLPRRRGSISTRCPGLEKMVASPRPTSSTSWRVATVQHPRLSQEAELPRGASLRQGRELHRLKESQSRTRKFKSQIIFHAVFFVLSNFEKIFNVYSVPNRLLESRKLLVWRRQWPRLWRKHYRFLRLRSPTIWTPLL